MAGTYEAMFYGLGSDGTVGANKNSIKIIGEITDNNAQAYFVYDSKKAGSMTTSHLRFGKKSIRAPYLIDNADFVACHNFTFLEKYDMLSKAKNGGTFLLCSPFDHTEVWDNIPAEVQQQIIDKKLKFYVINAIKLGEEIGLGARINVIMQTAFFKISNIIPLEQAIGEIKGAIKKSYGKAGEKVVEMNYKAVDAGLNNIYEVKVPATATSTIKMPPPSSATPPRNSSRRSPRRSSPVSATTCRSPRCRPTAPSRPPPPSTRSATSPSTSRSGTKQLCIQCGICSFVCPHATIRMKAYDDKALEGAPGDLQVNRLQDSPNSRGMKYTIQVAPEDCTGCGACVHNCPAKDKEDPKHKAINMQFQAPLRAAEAAQLRLLPGAARHGPDRGQAGYPARQPAGPAALRILRRLCRLRRNPVSEAALPALRRPGHDRQRHRLLLHLRRQPPHHPLGPDGPTDVVRPGPTRCSRTTPSSASA